MKNNIIGTRITRNVVCLLSIGLLLSCVKVDLTYYRESLVEILPLPAMPDVTLYYFYDEEGVCLDTVSGSGSGYRGKLGYGTYDVLVVNEVPNVEFRDMDTFGTASVYLDALPADASPSSGPALFYQPGDEMYALPLSSFVVEEGKDHTYSAVPVQLTHTVTLKLDLSRVAGEVVNIYGSLGGFSRGVNLSSRLPVKEVPAVDVSFGASAGSTRAVSNETTREVRIRSFGLSYSVSPDGSYIYEGVLRLTLEFADGTSMLVIRRLRGTILPEVVTLNLLLITVVIDPEAPDDSPVEIVITAGADDWETEDGSIDSTLT
jgi:hypothetical protein